MATFHCSVVTPERAVLETDARFVAFPAHDGEVGILPNRSALLTKLGVGVLRIDAPEGGERKFVIDGGFGQMIENRLTILTESAVEAGDVDRAAAQKTLEDALAVEAHSEAEHIARRREIAKARAELKVAPAPR